MQDDPQDDPQTDWAERRTDWAEDRTILASERTFAGWMRTALTSVAVALGLHALFRGFDPDWPVKAVASVFILAAIFVIWTAERAAARTSRRMDRHAVRAQPRRRLRIIAVVLTVASLATGAVLWLL